MDLNFFHKKIHIRIKSSCSINLLLNRKKHERPRIECENDSRIHFELRHEFYQQFCLFRLLWFSLEPENRVLPHQVQIINSVESNEKTTTTTTNMKRKKQHTVKCYLNKSGQQKFDFCFSLRGPIWINSSDIQRTFWLAKWFTRERSFFELLMIVELYKWWLPLTLVRMKWVWWHGWGGWWRQMLKCRTIAYCGSNFSHS